MLNRLRLSFALLSIVLLGLVALLVQRTLVTLEGERDLRHQSVAARVFDEADVKTVPGDTVLMAVGQLPDLTFFADGATAAASALRLTMPAPEEMVRRAHLGVGLRACLCYLD